MFKSRLPVGLHRGTVTPTSVGIVTFTLIRPTSDRQQLTIVGLVNYGRPM